MGFYGRAGRIVVLALLLSASAACREDGVKISSLAFKGVEHVSEADLRAALRTKSGSWIPFSPKPTFHTDEFQRDLQRLRTFYTERGYPDARVTDVDVLFDDKKEHVRLTVTVREGEPVRVASFSFQGFDVLPERRRRRMEEALGVAPGDIRDRARVDAARTAALNLLHEQGYPYAKVSIDEQPGETPKAIVVVVRADPGRQATFGPLEFQGNASVGDRVIARQLAFKEGDRYSASRVQASQSRLSSLDLFRFAYVEPRGEESQPPAIPVRITVAEDKHRQFTGAVGYGAEEKARIRGEWRHVNFFGGARTAGVESKWSSLDRGVRLNFNEPYFFTRHLAFSAQAQTWDEEEPVYRVTTYGGRFGLSWRKERRGPVSRRGASTSVGLTFIDEYNSYRVSEEALADPLLRPSLITLGLNPETGSAAGTLVSLRLQADRDTTSSRLDPHRGYAVSAAVEQAARVLRGSFRYTEVSGEARGYYSTSREGPLAGGRRPIVFAARLRGATIDAPEPTDASVPFFKRYFLGGSTSVRGWGRYEVSPLVGGQPIGGLTVVEGSTEVRLPVGQKLSAVGFVDAGSVGRLPWRLDDGFRFAVGPGVRYDTPIGPFRLDLGYQLNPIDGLLVKGKPEKRRWRAHISIGQAF
jgi:outer membrane protein insertion porin family/translocation and assembly module TamA